MRLLKIRYVFPACVGLFLVLLYLQQTSQPSVAVSQAATQNEMSAAAASIQNTNTYYNIYQTTGPDVKNSYVSELVERLKAQYGKSISDLSVQASLFSVRLSVLTDFPENGLVLFSDAVHIAFPELAQSILSIMKRFALYDHWLNEHEVEFASIPVKELDEMLWEKRYELFGDEAFIIWGHEQQILTAEQQEIKSLMTMLDQAFDISFDEKLHQLQTSLADAFDGTVQYAPLTPDMVAKAFFSFESVQTDLKKLNPAARQDKINFTRSQLGV